MSAECTIIIEISFQGKSIVASSESCAKKANFLCKLQCHMTKEMCAKRSRGSYECKVKFTHQIVKKLFKNKKVTEHVLYILV
jgi:hypothetical protein